MPRLEMLLQPAGRLKRIAERIGNSRAFRSTGKSCQQRVSVLGVYPRDQLPAVKDPASRVSCGQLRFAHAAKTRHGTYHGDFRAGGGLGQLRLSIPCHEAKGLARYLPSHNLRGNGSARRSPEVVGNLNVASGSVDIPGRVVVLTDGPNQPVFIAWPHSQSLLQRNSSVPWCR